MKKKIRDLTNEEIDTICTNHLMKKANCIGCKLNTLCSICKTGIKLLVRVVQEDELNVLLNQEVDVNEWWS